MDKVRIIIGWIFLIGILFFGYYFISGVDKKENNGDVSVFFPEASDDSDFIFINDGNYCMLIDTGLKEDIERNISKLKENGVEKIDVLVLTHPDKDHIGGAIDILENFEVGVIYQPYYDLENEELEKINDRIKELKIRSIIPIRSKNFRLGEMTVGIYPPFEKEYTEDNNYSLVVSIEHKGVNMLFAGDIKRKRTEEILNFNWEKVDLLKMPYHGRYYSNVDEFLKVFMPKNTVITSEKADISLKSILDEIGSNVYYAGKSDLKFISDGKEINKSLN